MVSENSDLLDLGMISDLKWIAIKETEPDEAKYQIQEIISQRFQDIQVESNQAFIKVLGFGLFAWALASVLPAEE